MTNRRSVGLSAVLVASGLFAFGCGQTSAPPQQDADTNSASLPTEVVSSANLIEHADLGPCPDGGARLSLSRLCAVDAAELIRPTQDMQYSTPKDCSWEVKELPFGADVMIYRALTCDDRSTVLTYSGGAHAVEFIYASSVLNRDDLVGRRAVRVQPSVDGLPDYRLRATFTGLTGVDPAKCEIRKAGDKFAPGARVIAPVSVFPDADCGGYAVSQEQDVFWLTQNEHVFAFSLPKGQRDIDPGSFMPVAPL